MGWGRVVAVFFFAELVADPRAPDPDGQRKNKGGSLVPRNEYSDYCTKATAEIIGINCQGATAGPKFRVTICGPGAAATPKDVWPSGPCIPPAVLRQ